MQGTCRRLAVVAVTSAVVIGFVGGFANADSASSGSTDSSTSANSNSATQAGKWRDLADQVYENGEADYDAVVADGGNVQSFHVAALTWYAGERFGWQDDRTKLWLSRVYERLTSSGGYGLGFAWDAYQDTTTNPADTTYGISTAWHVGQVLLTGYDAGAVPKSRVRQAVNALLDFGTAGNQACVSYSKHPNDEGQPCVWNVSAAAAMFLSQAYERGIIPPGRGGEMREKYATWRDYVAENYDPELGGWTYQEGGPQELDDAGHFAVTVAAMLELEPALGKKALATYWEHYTGWASSVELMPRDCDRAEPGYEATADHALSDRGSDSANMGRAAYAGVALRVHSACEQGEAEPTASASASTSTSAGPSQWRELADQVYANGVTDYDAVVEDGGNVQSYHVASMAWYAGQRFGWRDDRTKLWLSRIYDRQNPSGGYGLGIAWDPYHDGTTNPADTTYTITTGWHVGRVLLAGYDAGVVPKQRLTRAVTSTLDSPLAAGDRCAAYSRHVNDEGKPCVWNVSAAAAWFLSEAFERDLVPAGRAAEMREKYTTWRGYVAENYDPKLGGWTYLDDGSDQLDDPGHLAATVGAMYELEPALGKEALAKYWEHYTGTASSVDVMHLDCVRADAGYEALETAALTDLGSPEENVARAAYAGLVERVDVACPTE